MTSEGRGVERSVSTRERKQNLKIVNPRFGDIGVGGCWLVGASEGHVGCRQCTAMSMSL